MFKVLFKTRRFEKAFSPFFATIQPGRETATLRNKSDPNAPGPVGATVLFF
jgi:hypothetical protein